MPNLYSVYVRHTKECDEDYGNSYRQYTVSVDDYLGSYSTLAAAAEAANKVNISTYTCNIVHWDEDVWTNFVFVYKHKLNSPLDENLVGAEADRISTHKYEMWKISPAGVAHSAAAEKRIQDYKTQHNKNIEAEKERIRAKARAARALRAAKKAALTDASS
jgi:hypothetical protein